MSDPPFYFFDDPLVHDDPGRDPQETAFLHSVIEDPDDDSTRLIFADWLDEQGQADKAAFVRFEVEISRLPQASERYAALRDELVRLDALIGGQWIWAFIRPRRLLNCGEPKTPDRVFRFAYQCPNRWADLTPLSQANERYCPQCSKNVHYCASKDEAETHAAQGHCVAIGSWLALAIKQQYGGPPAPKTTAGEIHLRLGDVPLDDDDFEMGEADVTGMTGMLMSPYEVWALELFARHPARAKRWWQFWK